MKIIEDVAYHFIRYTTDEMIQSAIQPVGPWNVDFFFRSGGALEPLRAEERFFVFQLLRITANEQPDKPILKWSVRMLAKRCYSSITVVSSTLKKLDRFIEEVEQPTKPEGYIFRENKRFAPHFFTLLHKRTGLLPDYKRMMQNRLLKPHKLFIDSCDGRRFLMTRAQRWLLSILLEFSESNGYVCFHDMNMILDLAGMKHDVFIKVCGELIKYNLIESSITSPRGNYTLLRDKVIMQLNLSNNFYGVQSLSCEVEVFDSLVDVEELREDILCIQEKYTNLPHDYMPNRNLYFYVVKLLQIASYCLTERYRVRVFVSYAPTENDPVSIARRALQVLDLSAHVEIETALAYIFEHHIEAIISNTRLSAWLSENRVNGCYFALHPAEVSTQDSFASYEGAVVVKAYQVP